MPQAHYEDDVTIQVPILKAQFDMLRQHIDERFDALCDQQRNMRRWMGINSLGVALALIGVIALALALSRLM